jgi:hypothetical protein
MKCNLSLQDHRCIGSPPLTFNFASSPLPLSQQTCMILNNYNCTTSYTWKLPQLPERSEGTSCCTVIGFGTPCTASRSLKKHLCAIGPLLFGKKVLVSQKGKVSVLLCHFINSKPNMNTDLFSLIFGALN